MAAILNFSFQKTPLRMTSAHISLWGAIHAQAKEKQTFISKNKAAPMIIKATPMTTLILQTKILKNHSAPEYTRGPRQGDIFCPRVYSGAAFKGLMHPVTLKYIWVTLLRLHISC